MTAGTIQRDTVRETGHARVDLFGPDSVEQSRRMFRLDREPTGPELLAWARATKDLPPGELRIHLPKTPTGLLVPAAALGPAPGDPPFGDELVIADENTLTRLGRARFGNLFIGATGAASQALNATHARIGVGDGTTAAADTDTDFSAAAGATHRQFKLVDSVAQGTGANSGVSTFVATFASGTANFTLPWQEWGIDGGTADGTTVTAETASTPGLCNHRVVLILTKTSLVVAVFTATITLT